MLFEEIMEKEFKAGYAEGYKEGYEEGLLLASQEIILELLNESEPVTNELKTRIQAIEDKEVLSNLITKAGRVGSIAEFEKELDALNC